jgi:hypothetical protein
VFLLRDRLFLVVDNPQLAPRMLLFFTPNPVISQRWSEVKKNNYQAPDGDYLRRREDAVTHDGTPTK